MLPLILALKLQTKSKQASNDGTLTGSIMVLGSMPVHLILTDLSEMWVFMFLTKKWKESLDS